MKAIFLFSALIFTSCNLFGQFDFRVDTTRIKTIAFTADTSIKNINADFDKKLDSAYNLNKDYKFEFRLWERGMMNNSNNVFIMQFANNKWSAKYFGYNNNWQNDGNDFKEINIGQKYVDQLWTIMLGHDVLKLPDASKLITKFYVADTIDLNEFGNYHRIELIDGLLYCFELKTPTQSKYYNYACPARYLKYAGTVKELYDAFVIITAVKKFLGIKCNCY